MHSQTDFGLAKNNYKFIEKNKNKSTKFIWKKKLIIINSTLNIYLEEFKYVLNDEGCDINLYENAFIL